MTIAHITDLHLRRHLPGTARIAARRSREIPDLLEKAAVRIRAMAPDLVVLTGDLLDYPLDALDDDATRRNGERDLRLIAELLEPIPCPIAIVHGNHDHPRLVRSVFASVPAEFTVAGYRVVSFFDDEAEHNVPHRTGDDRHRFENALDDRDPTPQIHVQHYLIRPHVSRGYPFNYADADELGKRIADSGKVRLVVSGHYHEGHTPERVHATTTWFATAPAFAEAPHPVWFYHLDGETVSKDAWYAGESL